jgi:hypothetical protein
VIEGLDTASNPNDSTEAFHVQLIGCPVPPVMLHRISMTVSVNDRVAYAEACETQDCSNDPVTDTLNWIRKAFVYRPQSLRMKRESLFLLCISGKGRRDILRYVR